MKLLTVAVPCYNSAAYMKNCIESLLVDLEKIEIVIVNDGSTKDNTAEIADEYASQYPDTIKVVHKENGGHGSAVNSGLANATGKYFKIVDSDDRLDKENLVKMLELLSSDIDVDMVISDFLYDKQEAKNKMLMNYKDCLPVGKIFTWDDVKKFPLDKYFMMHSLIYRTEVLRECKLELPHHTFYVDNAYVYFPLPYLKKMYYYDICLYYYFIGRDDQSVNEKVMISRLDQQIKVNKLLYDKYDLTTFTNAHLKSYMYHHLVLVTAVSTVMALKEGSEQRLADKKALWEYMKEKNPDMYKKIRHFSLIGTTLHIPGEVGRKTVLQVYQMLQKHMGFN